MHPLLLAAPEYSPGGLRGDPDEATARFQEPADGSSTLRTDPDFSILL